MARLYPKPGKRTIKDADLLVDRQHLQAALNSLSDLGFRPLENHALERLETFLDHSPGFSGNKAIVLYGPGDFELDLHWAVGVAGLEPAALLGRSETVTLFGTPVRVASFEDALLLTAKHAIRENLTVDAMCRDLLDIRRSWERSDSWRNFEEILANPALRNNLVPLLAITDVLRVLDSDHRAVGEAAERLTGLATRTERKAARRLCELFFYQVKHGPVTKDLLYLAHSRPAKQVIVAAWTNWREYRDLMRSLEEKLDGEEVPLVRRLRLLAGAIIKTQPGQLRSIRALARLKYRD